MLSWSLVKVSVTELIIWRDDYFEQDMYMLGHYDLWFRASTTNDVRRMFSFTQIKSQGLV